MAFPSPMLSCSALSRHQTIPRLRQTPTPRVSLSSARPLTQRLCLRSKIPPLHFAISSAGGNNDDGSGGGGRGGSGGRGGDGGSSGGNRGEAPIVLAQVRKLESLPAEGGHVAGELLRRLADMERSQLLRWLLQFQGFRERLLADDLFLAKVAMEWAVSVIAKTAMEYEKRRENFVKEIDIVISNVAMAIGADFMLIYLPAPTVSLQPSLGSNARIIPSLCHNCPDIISQIALGARAYLLLDKFKTIGRNGPTLYALATRAFLVDTSVVDALAIARKAVVEELDEKVEEIAAVSTPDKVEEIKWWSRFEAGAELSAGIVLPHSSMRGGRFHPAAMTNVSAFFSRGSSGRSGKNGTA